MYCYIEIFFKFDPSCSNLLKYYLSNFDQNYYTSILTKIIITILGKKILSFQDVIYLFFQNETLFFYEN